VRTLDAALELVGRTVADVWSIDIEDVLLARELHDQFPHLGARDLCHLACCRRRGASEIKTFDRGLAVVAARVL
jgi:predicted nucleic acid-binding protein